jgi:integrase/recombinase XerD
VKLWVLLPYKRYLFDSLEMLEAPRNLKHRAMLVTMYGAGLRVSEVAKLKVSDLDRERRVIWVRGSKGRNHRIHAPS